MMKINQRRLMVLVIHAVHDTLIHRFTIHHNVHYYVRYSLDRGIRARFKESV